MASESMVVRVKDYPDFLTSVYNYIIEEYEVEPRDFEVVTNIRNEVDDIIDRDGGTGLKYVHGDGALLPFACYDYRNDRRALHTHTTVESNRHLLFCSEPEIAALVYINRSVYGPNKERLIGTLKVWLPTVTVEDVTVRFGDTCNVVRSDLYPSYSVHFLRHRSRARFADLTYVYHPESERTLENGVFRINIVADERGAGEYTVTDEQSGKSVMVKRRSRSRSRSRGRSASPVRRRRHRSRSRSQKRRTGGRRRSSRSPAATTASRPNGRKRSRSRSRSRSP